MFINDVYLKFCDFDSLFLSDEVWFSFGYGIWLINLNLVVLDILMNILYMVLYKTLWYFIVLGLNKVVKKLNMDCVSVMVGWDFYCGFFYLVWV